MLAILLAPVALAHPLDDRAQMASEVVIDSDYRLEYVIDFRYVSVLASYSEFSGGGMGRGLDADDDGFVSHAELKRRYNDLVDQLTMAFGIEVDGRMITLEPDFDRFQFENMDAPGAIDLAEPVPIDSFRIHYRFVFYWNAPRPLEAGSHEVTYFFNQQQSVIHTPSEQMIAFDARSTPRVRIADVTYDDGMGAIPRLVFHWTVDKPPRPEEVPTVVTPPPINIEPIDHPDDQPVTELPSPTGMGELPAWVALFVGVGLALGGIIKCVLAIVGRGAVGSRNREFLMACLFVLAGVAVLLGAVVRIGLISPF